MADLQVTCAIRRVSWNNEHEGITHLGGHGWLWSRSDVIFYIRNGTHTFFTLVDRKRAEVGVNEGPNGPYLQPHADGYWNNNLLALPVCR